MALVSATFGTVWPALTFAHKSLLSLTAVQDIFDRIITCCALVHIGEASFHWLCCESCNLEHGNFFMFFFTSLFVVVV